MTSRGLHGVLHDELTALGLKVLEKEPAGVWFDSSWEGCYKANLYLHSATRIVKPLLQFPAYQNDELYCNVRKHDFTKYIEPSESIAVEAHVRDSSFRDHRFVALKVKDAIVDQFREKLGTRPDVNKKAPHLKVVVRIVKNQVSLSLDTSGESLAFRGYRKNAGPAPLREHLAAALIKISGWKPGVPLIDPMCGSGTILIEAAMMARAMAPGIWRQGFAFQGFKEFQKDVWDRVVKEAVDREKEGPVADIYGFDCHPKAIQDSLVNAKEAGVENDIVFKKEFVSLLKNPCVAHEVGNHLAKNILKDTRLAAAPLADNLLTVEEKKGILVVNPPYGERMGSLDEVMDTYKDLAFTLKRRFKGWTCWIISGNAELTRALQLKASAKHPIYNGPLECRFLKYKIL